jgi:hypothetical protein
MHYQLKHSFVCKPRNLSVRTNGCGWHNTPARKKAIGWAVKALMAARAHDDYSHPTIRKGSTEGQFSFYSWCEDIVTGVRYDRVNGVWLASVTRSINMRDDLHAQPQHMVIEFDIAIIAA